MVLHQFSLFSGAIFPHSPAARTARVRAHPFELRFRQTDGTSQTGNLAQERGSRGRMGADAARPVGWMVFWGVSPTHGATSGSTGLAGSKTSLPTTLSSTWTNQRMKHTNTMKYVWSCKTVQQQAFELDCSGSVTRTAQFQGGSHDCFGGVLSLHMRESQSTGSESTKDLATYYMCTKDITIYIYTVYKIT